VTQARSNRCSTAARPLTTYRGFAKSTTGAMLAGQVTAGGRDAGYALWVAPFRAGDGHGEEISFRRGAGGRVAIELAPELYLGMSAAAFTASRGAGRPEPGAGSRSPAPSRVGAPDSRMRPGIMPEAGVAAAADGTRRLAGIDASWRAGGFQFLSEATWLSGTNEQPAERGAFIQAAIPLVRGVHLTSRAEVYSPVVTEPLRIYTAGLAWRPWPQLTLKAERQATDRPSRRAADGWLVSLSGLY